MADPTRDGGDARFVVAAAEIDDGLGPRVGGKALALARMARAGIAVPPFVAVTTDAYGAFLDATELRTRILFELDRKDFADMRWEEMWDAALRIRNLFLKTPLPDELRAALAEPVAARFADVATVVRSSAPGEDSAAASFAGLHESYVNVRGVDAILEHVKLVWASLWSDGALLYRRELGLDPTRSTMAVVVQEIVAGERSGRRVQPPPGARRTGPGRGRARPEPGPRRRHRGARPLDAGPPRRARRRASRSRAPRDDGAGRRRGAPRGPARRPAPDAAARGRTSCLACTRWRSAPRRTSTPRRTWSGRCAATTCTRCSRGRSRPLPARPATGAPRT